MSLTYSMLFILSDDRTECVRDPCQDITLNEISINETEDREYIIEPNNTYIFTIEKENFSYYFYSEFEKFFYVFNGKHVLEAVENGTGFMQYDKIYVNYFVNITSNTKVSIKVVNLDPDKEDKKNKKLSGGAIALIIIATIIVIIAIILIIIHYERKKIMSDTEIENKTDQLDTILQ